MTVTRTRPAPVLPASLSMFDPVYVADDETGRPDYLDFADQVGIILAGEPGAGKSVGLANIVAHGALAFTDCRLTLIDGALVELGIWRDCAHEFVGPDINHAIAVIEKQQQEITDCSSRATANRSTSPSLTSSPTTRPRSGPRPNGRSSTTPCGTAWRGAASAPAGTS